MRYLFIILIPILTSCETLPMLLREISISEKFELDVQHKKKEPESVLSEDMSAMRGTGSN